MLYSHFALATALTSILIAKLKEIIIFCSQFICVLSLLCTIHVRTVYTEVKKGTVM